MQDWNQRKEPWNFVQMNMSLLPIARPVPVSISKRKYQNDPLQKPRTPNATEKPNNISLSPKRILQAKPTTENNKLENGIMLYNEPSLREKVLLHQGQKAVKYFRHQRDGSKANNEFHGSLSDRIYEGTQHRKHGAQTLKLLSGKKRRAIDDEDQVDMKADPRITVLVKRILEIQDEEKGSIEDSMRSCQSIQKKRRLW